MSGPGTFRFHRFSEEEKKPYRYNTTSNKFFNSNSFTNPHKIRAYQNTSPNQGFYNNNINNLNYKSYQFQKKYPSNITNINLKSFQTNNTNEDNPIYSKNNIAGLNQFPLKALINSDFEIMLQNGDLTRINEILTQMVLNNISFTNNNHLQLVLNKFQILLRFLFSEQQKLLNINNQIEGMFNDKNSNLNKKIEQLDKEENKINNLLTKNQLHIGLLRKKIKNYKNILVSSGHERLIPNKILSDIQPKDGVYHCQICPGKIFKSYEQIHTHYIIEHFNSNDNNMIYNSNMVNKRYFDNKLNTLKNELKNELYNINMQYDDYSYKRNDDLGEETNLKNKNSNYYERIQSQRNRPLSSNNLPIYSNFNLNGNNEINSYLRKLEIEQKMQYENLNDNLNKLKNEIFNEIKNLAKNKPLSHDKKILDDINVETNIIQKNTTIINENNNNLDNNEKINENPYQFNNFNNNDNLYNNNKKNNDYTNNKDNDYKTYKNKINDNNNEFNNNINYNKEFNNNNEFNNDYNMNNNLDKDNKNYNMNIVNNNYYNYIHNENISENENDINNKSKLLSNIKDKYTKNIQTIREESGRNESTLNNNNSKYTYRERTTQGNMNKSSIIGDQIIDNPYSKDKKNNDNNKILTKSKFGDSINIINDNNSLITNPDKNQFKELYDKREKATLFNKNNDLLNVYDHYKIINIDKNYTESVLKLKNDNIENLIKDHQNKYLNNNNEKSIKKDEYIDIILNIMNDNINKGKNNSLFMKYYNNLIEKNNLNSILQKIEDEKKQKEIDMKNNEEEDEIKQTKIGINSNEIDFDDILNTKPIKKKKNQIRESQLDIYESNTLKNLEKGGGDDSI